jgi:site-specific DNA-methyltransferase (adenine-specific)
MILRADARALPLADDSVDSIVTDPPYELGFMGKAWDRSGVAYRVDVWAEALRVLKPGGHLLAFGGSRTYHRMACAIEDAGFEIRDQIQWLYGSGFPKSLDVSKAIDKAAGIWRGRAGSTLDDDDKRSFGQHYELTAKGSGETAAAAAWDGWGTALKPAHEPIVMARKPLGESTVAANVLAHGTGAINVDGCRVEGDKGVPTSVSNAGQHGWSTGGDMDRKRVQNGRWPANVITDGSEEVVRLFPQTGSGAGNPTIIKRKRNKGWCNSSPGDGVLAIDNFGDSGSAARFFYVAKASKTDRGEGNNHPTVKPTDLMRYLCRLVTPPGGIVLDPFAGSGSTLRGAFLEGFKPIGIELDAEYCRIARGRMNLLTPAMAGLMG